MRRLIALFVLAGLALAATATAATLAPGWTTRTSTAGGFALDTPSAWIKVSDATPALKAEAKQNPSLQAYVDYAVKTKSIKLLVVDLGSVSIAHAFASNVNVVQTPAIGTLEEQRQILTAQLKASGLVDGSIRSRLVTLPAGRSLRLDYHTKTTGQIVATEQFVLLRKGVSTVVTYSTLPSLTGAYRATFDHSIASFRFS